MAHVAAAVGLLDDLDPVKPAAMAQPVDHVDPTWRFRRTSDGGIEVLWNGCRYAALGPPPPAADAVARTRRALMFVTDILAAIVADAEDGGREAAAAAAELMAELYLC